MERDLVHGTLKPPLVLFQWINPRFAAHAGPSYESRRHIITTDIIRKYIPPKWQDTRTGAHHKRDKDVS